MRRRRVSGIRRKIAGQTKGATPPARGAEACWPVALARASRDAVGLDLVAGPLKGGKVSLAELLDMPPDRSFVAMLEGPREAMGLLILAPDVLAGMIERQTLGRVTAQPPEPRRPTRTDAAMVAGLIDASLAALDQALVEEDDRIWAGGFRYASYLADARPLGLILEDAPYRVMRFEAALSGGKKTGTILLALPAEGRGSPPTLRQSKADAEEGARFQTAFADQVLASGATLDAVLARITLPLDEVMALAPGEVLRLGMVSVDRIDIDGLNGVRLGGGKLGQNRGMRAVRLANTQAVPRGTGALSPGLAMLDVAMARTGTG